MRFRQDRLVALVVTFAVTALGQAADHGSSRARPVSGASLAPLTELLEAGCSTHTGELAKFLARLSRYQDLKARHRSEALLKRGRQELAPYLTGTYGNSQDGAAVASRFVIGPDSFGNESLILEKYPDSGDSPTKYEQPLRVSYVEKGLVIVEQVLSNTERAVYPDLRRFVALRGEGGTALHIQRLDEHGEGVECKADDRFVKSLMQEATLARRVDVKPDAVAAPLVFGPKLDAAGPGLWHARAVTEEQREGVRLLDEKLASLPTGVKLSSGDDELRVSIRGLPSFVRKLVERVTGGAKISAIQILQGKRNEAPIGLVVSYLDRSGKTARLFVLGGKKGEPVSMLLHLAIPDPAPPKEDQNPLFSNFVPEFTLADFTESVPLALQEVNQKVASVRSLGTLPHGKAMQSFLATELKDLTVNEPDAKLPPISIVYAPGEIASQGPGTVAHFTSEMGLQLTSGNLSRGVGKPIVAKRLGEFPLFVLYPSDLLAEHFPETLVHESGHLLDYFFLRLPNDIEQAKLDQRFEDRFHSLADAQRKSPAYRAALEEYRADLSPELLEATPKEKREEAIRIAFERQADFGLDFTKVKAFWKKRWEYLNTPTETFSFALQIHYLKESEKLSLEKTIERYQIVRGIPKETPLPAWEEALVTHFYQTDMRTLVGEIRRDGASLRPPDPFTTQPGYGY